MSFIDDLLYNGQSDGQVYNGQPQPGEGQNNSETWRLIPNKGLYHFKKHNGSWFSRLYTDQVLTQSEEIREVNVEEIIVQSAEGTFIDMKVTGTLDLTGCDIVNGYSFTGALNSGANRQISLDINSENLVHQGSPTPLLNTIQDIHSTASPTFNAITITTNATISGSLLGTDNTITVDGLINNVNVLYGSGDYGSPSVQGIGLGDLTQAEVDQLEGINSTTISSTQWGYLGAMNQPVQTTAPVTFHSVITQSVEPIVRLSDTTTSPMPVSYTHLTLPTNREV